MKIMGQVLTSNTGQNPARQAAIRSGIPKKNQLLLLIKFAGQFKISYIRFSKYKNR